MFRAIDVPFYNPRLAVADDDGGNGACVVGGSNCDRAGLLRLRKSVAKNSQFRQYNARLERQDHAGGRNLCRTTKGWRAGTGLERIVG